MNGSEEVARECWSVSMRFSFLPEIPAELVVRNPMGRAASAPGTQTAARSGKT